MLGAGGYERISLVNRGGYAAKAYVSYREAWTQPPVCAFRESEAAREESWLEAGNQMDATRDLLAARARRKEHKTNG
jgi:hypothetical protein